VAAHPEAEIAGEAQKELSVLTEKEAQKVFDVAQYYERTLDASSATVYYKNLIAQYPDTTYALQSAQRLDALEQMQEKK
jgi:outer membrane protein assembly factor BamD (BamD/ComL family)